MHYCIIAIIGNCDPHAPYPYKNQRLRTKKENEAAFVQLKLKMASNSWTGSHTSKLWQRENFHSVLPVVSGVSLWEIRWANKDKNDHLNCKKIEWRVLYWSYASACDRSASRQPGKVQLSQFSKGKNIFWCCCCLCGNCNCTFRICRWAYLWINFVDNFWYHSEWSTCISKLSWWDNWKRKEIYSILQCVELLQGYLSEVKLF